MEQYQAANRNLWNEWAAIHEQSPFYDVEGFKAGRVSLHRLEREEVGDVSGKSLLHLQCHFGLDTLSWARLGATVTGIDFSDKAIEIARRLSDELQIPATFVLSDVYRLPDVLSGQFDIVFTSYGVLCWLPDIPRWAQVVARYLKPGGIFYIVEFHPFAYVFDDEAKTPDLSVRYPYFGKSEPLTFTDGSSYADPSVTISQPVHYEWDHRLGEIVTALIDAGLRIEFLHEFPYSVFAHMPFMQCGEDGYYHLSKGEGMIPLMYSLRAKRCE
ncbi:MAG: methyltransferase domain-containing protein [Anaerolineae bacterium]|nr:methyltransferase domain-containing protein [Anaerolineae bacterium]